VDVEAPRICRRVGDMIVASRLEWSAIEWDGQGLGTVRGSSRARCERSWNAAGQYAHVAQVTRKCVVVMSRGVMYA
jgi:hypothetical protein